MNAATQPTKTPERPSTPINHPSKPTGHHDLSALATVAQPFLAVRVDQAPQLPAWYGMLPPTNDFFFRRSVL
jgi:hypothetical protein